MARITELLEEKRAVVVEMNDMAKSMEADKRSLTDEEQAKANKAEARAKEIDKEIEFLRQTEKRNKEIAEKQESEQREKRDKKVDQKLDGKTVYKRYLRVGKAGLTAEERSFLQSGGHLSAEQRAQNVTANNQGGILVNTEFANELIRDLKDYAGILSVANVFTTATGGDLKYFTADGTTEKAVAIAELTEPAQDTLTYGDIVLGAYKYTPKTILLSNEVLQDAGIDVAADVRGQLVERVGRMQAEQTITGSGSSAPQGVLTGTTQSHAAAGAGLAMEDFLGLEHTLDRAYRQSENLRYVFNDATLLQIKLLSLAAGNDFFWQPSFRDGAPDRIGGIQYTVAADMPNVATGQTPVLLGDFSKYRVRMVDDFAIKRIVDKYIELDAVGFTGFVRWDAKVMQSKAFAKLQMA